MKLTVMLIATLLPLIYSQGTCYCSNGVACLPSEICPDLTKCEDNCVLPIVHQNIIPLSSVSTKRPNKTKTPTKQPTRKPTRRPSRRPSRSPTRKPTLQRLQIDLSGAFGLEGVTGYIKGSQFVSIIYNSLEQISKPNILSYNGILNDNTYVPEQSCPFSTSGLGLIRGYILRFANNQCEIVKADSNSPLYQVPTLAPITQPPLSGGITYAPTIQPVVGSYFNPFTLPPYLYPRSIQQNPPPPVKPTQDCTTSTNKYFCG